MRALLIPLLSVAIAIPALAKQAAPAPVPRPNGFRGEILADLDEVQDKIMRLAGAIPAEKYTWRPAAGVRSVSEVYMHIAGGNYFLTTFVGQQPPADIPTNLEKITDKQTVLAELRRSFDHLRRVILNEPDADLEKMANMFGKPSTHRRMLSMTINHLHEHLGQSIAYARMNGIAPPWSE